MSEKVILILLLFLTVFSNSWLLAVSTDEPTVPDTVCLIGKIQFSGNRSTRESIIRRELMFREGDTLLRSELAILIEKSRKNLLNTSLFNFVDVDTVCAQNSPSRIDLHFNFTERWYLWPFPIVKLVDRNFNSWIQSGDMQRVTYGFYVQKDNFRGKRERLIATFITGFERVYGFSYDIPYLTGQQNIGLSFSTFYKQNHTVYYDSHNNKPKEIKDNAAFLKTSLLNSVRFSFRQGIHYYNYLTLTHHSYDFSDTLVRLNPYYSFPGIPNPRYFSLSYRLKADFRDFQPYPLAGYILDVELTKHGLDFPGHSDPNLLTARASFRKYWKLDKRWNYAAGLTGKTNLQQKLPFFLMQGLGYENDFVRGYEYYVVDGEHYLLFRQDVKWTLLTTRVNTLKVVPESIGKLHYTIFLTGFTDLAYVRSDRLDNLNYLADRWLLGTGIGLNMVTYYDKVIRIEVSHNHFGETGLFIHFVAPI